MVKRKKTKKTNKSKNTKKTKYGNVGNEERDTHDVGSNVGGEELQVTNETFKIEQPNQCKLKFNIPVRMVNKINEELHKNYEISGVIHCDNSNKVVGMKTEKGSADSVYTPNNVINFHTHPISAYNQGDTVWGWPSGEDIRETIKFSLAGNKAHLVFSVEGLYTIQISPCKIRKMKELDDKERGVLIFVIEEFFKTTHNFRGVQEINEFAKKNIFINPYSYVDFVNTFDVVNLLNAKKIVHTEHKTENIKNIGHTGIHSYDNDNINRYGEGDSTFTRIPNVGFPDIKGGKIVNESVKNYIKKEDIKELRSITANGQEESFSGKKDVDDIVEYLQTILKKFEVSDCNITWNNKNNSWFFVNFFPSNNYRQKSFFEGQKFITPGKSISVTTDVEPFIRVFSDKKEGCTINEIAHSNKFKIGRMTNMGSKTCTNRHGSHSCGFGKKHKNKHKMPHSTLKTLLKDLKKVMGNSSSFGNYIGSEEEEIQAKQVKERLNNKKELLKLINENGYCNLNKITLGDLVHLSKQEGFYSWVVRVKELIKSLGLPITDKSTIAELKRAI